MDTIFNGVNAIAALLGVVVTVVLWLLDRRQLKRKFRSELDSYRRESGQKQGRQFIPPKEDRWREGYVKYVDKSKGYYYIETSDNKFDDDVLLTESTRNYFQVDDLKVGDKVKFRVFKANAQHIEKVS